MVKLIWSNSLDQVNLMYTAKFDTFFPWPNFEKIEHVLIYQINLMKKSWSKRESQSVRKKYKNKTANEWNEISFHINNSNSQPQILQPEFTTWKYKVNSSTVSLKIKKLSQGKTEIFTSEYKKEESLCHVMSQIYKNSNAKKTSFKRLSNLKWAVKNSSFPIISLLVCLLIWIQFLHF